MKNSPKPLAKTATLDLYVVSPEETPNSKQATDPVTNATIFLTTPAIITAADVATIQLSEDPPNLPSLCVNLTPTGTTKLATATINPTDMKIAFVVNGTVIAVPQVMVPMSTGFRISGGELAKNREQLFKSLTKD
jgi:preprotein translocase subunit SecD